MEENTSPDVENQSPVGPKKPISVLPKLEVLIIVVFFASFLVWTANRCSSTREKYQEIERQAMQDDSIYNSEITFEEAPITPENESVVNSTSSDPIASTSENKESTNTVREKYTPLYVTLPNLNMRDRPNLSGRILARLKTA